MSQDEKDTEKSFLSRWSQRKQAAKQPETDGAAERSAEEADAAPAPVVEGDADEEFDLSSLPKLEDITETTDITGFLRKGVPESLRNAALRKSWALDPAIRNYVNPALDYAYDWNTPGGVPGSSEIAAGTDISKMVLQIMGGESSSAQQSSDTLPHSDAPAAASGDSGIALQNSEADLPLQQVRVSAPSSTTTPVAADFKQTEQDRIEIVQAVDEIRSNASQHPSRRHGSAKPRIQTKVFEAQDEPMVLIGTRIIPVRQMPDLKARVGELGSYHAGRGIRAGHQGSRRRRLPGEGHWNCTAFGFGMVAYSG